MQRAHSHLPPLHFGLLLKLRREFWQIKQREVLAHLPGWTQANYSRLESGAIAPSFEQLIPLYTAFGLAGVQWSAADRQQFLELARRRIEEKKTHWDRRSEADWAQLRYQLANVEILAEEPTASRRGLPASPLLADIRHLVGREEWVQAVLHAIGETPVKKLVVLQGPMGIGKSSELHRLAWHFLRAAHPTYRVLWLPLLASERASDPQSALEVFLGNILAELGDPLPASSSVSLQTRMHYVLTELEHSNRPTVMLVDNAESLLNEQGLLATCWENFLAAFLRGRHQGRLLLATREWPGWSGRERVFVAEFTIPLLPVPTSIILLQRLGLERVPLEHLRAISERVGGIPLCLEWVAALVQDALLSDDWQTFDPGEATSQESSQQQEGVTQRLLRLLEDPSLLAGHFASKLQPLLERIMDKRLSPEARQVLNRLAVSPLPLGKTALQVLCKRPRLLKELRDASLLVAYPSRVQLLPMVASAVQARFTSEERRAAEEDVIEALLRWVEEGTMHNQEAGHVVTELTVLLIKQHRLLDAAQVLLPYSSLSFNKGHAPRLARLVAEIMGCFDWHGTESDECGVLLLHYLLTPFAGEAIDDEQRAVDSYHILDMILAEKVTLEASIEGHIINYLMLYAITRQHFEEAQTLLDAYCTRLESRQMTETSLQIYLLELRAWLFGAWCDYAEERGEKRRVQKLREETIDLYRQCILLRSTHEEPSLLRRSLARTRLARYYNSLGYHLAGNRQFDEALQAVERGLALREQGYIDFGGLAVAYGEKSEILMELGRLQEAVLFDEKAIVEIQRLADAGHIPSQEEKWLYLANRGRLYLRLGRVDEAERLLHEALPKISLHRRVYRMSTKKALDEIEEWKRTANSSLYQLDWRWVERYRQLASFDSYWWLAPAGPFTGEEQEQWDQTYASNIDEATKEQLGILLAQSRQRELMRAVAERREPHLHYPALAIADVRRRISDLLQLDTEIQQDEPHALVRYLYHDAIEEEITFLRLIEATYKGNNREFWSYNLSLNPLPSEEEMYFALSRLKQLLLQGLRYPETAERSQQMIAFLSEQLHVSIDLLPNIAETQETPPQVSSSFAYSQPVVSPQAARRFFEAVLRKYRYEGWQVVIDPGARSARIEQGLRQIFLADTSLSVEQIRHYLSHELAGHVSRCVAGEHSLLGLLGIHTKHSLETEEGLAVYYDRQMAILAGQRYDDTAIWTAVLATGLAGGVLTAPQTFLSLCDFFESFYLLYQLLQRLDANVEQAQEIARKYALSICLRIFRGVPDLHQAGVCFSKDAHYLRGLWKIERAVAEDESVLDRLAVGVVALEYLPVLQELGIVTAPASLRELLHDPELDSYILSFREEREQPVT